MKKLKLYHSTLHPFPRETERKPVRTKETDNTTTTTTGKPESLGSGAHH